LRTESLKETSTAIEDPPSTLGKTTTETDTVLNALRSVTTGLIGTPTLGETLSFSLTILATANSSSEFSYLRLVFPLSLTLSCSFFIFLFSTCKQDQQLEREGKWGVLGPQWSTYFAK
jgi:cytochrome c biogenesis protein CcdA